MTQSETPLHLFKEQLVNEGERLAHDHDLEEIGQRLIWWYFRNIKNYSIDKINEIFCDGYGDLGIDAIDIDSDKRIHFYQFKNPENINKPFQGGDIDKVITGLNLIISKKYSDVANEDLKGRIDDIIQIVPSSYLLHLVVSSNTALGTEAEAKLNSFFSGLGGRDYFDWQLENLKWLWDTFYTKHLPTVDEQILFKNVMRTLPVISSDHRSYIFSLPGKDLAELYEKYREKLLQQNIRVSEGNKPANKSIEQTCTGQDSANFFHYNNGVTFLCESARYDDFANAIILEKAQIVNGGQTIRVLHKAYSEGRLKDDVLVLVRVISSSGHKEFANNVAVNLNNQTTVDPSFLKSNDPRILQLYHSILSLGWYLERREDEVGQLPEIEIELLARQIGQPLDTRVIPLKDGAQSYVAVFLGELELAKKNPQKIFQERQNGGVFERIFDDKLTAEKFINSYRIRSAVQNFVDEFGKLKRKRSKMENWQMEYAKLLGRDLVPVHSDLLHQMIPQSSLFLCALVYWKHVDLNERPVDELIEHLELDFEFQINALRDIIEFGKDKPERIFRAWPTLLRSQEFFDEVREYLNNARQ